jgi:TetR/AcrR family transcriptional regulator, mexJK operon transcriptional repressor
MDHSLSNTPPKTANLRGRPVDRAKRELIQSIARQRFVAFGFAGLAMEGVAAEAGVAKMTLYKIYGDRTGLLQAIVQAESERMRTSLVESGESRDLACLVRHYAWHLLTLWLRPEAQAFERQLLAHAIKHPELVQAFFDYGPGKIRAELALALQTHHGCNTQDATHWAEELMAAISGALPLEQRAGLPQTHVPTHEQLTNIRSRLDRILRRHIDIAPSLATQVSAPQN